MTVTDIRKHRLHHQHISRQGFKRPEEIVAWLGALQGQDYSGAKWSIGLRLPDCTDADVEQALADKRLIRTWVMRGTLHVVTAEDVRWLVELFAPRIIPGNTRRYRELELDDATLARSTELLAGALQDGSQLNRGDLFPMLEQHGISTAGQRGVYMLQRASYEGLICQTTAPRNQPLFMTMPPAKSLPRDEALAELARRYFASRGPASLQDFAAWSGLPMAEVRAGLDAVKSQLVEEKIDGQTYWRADATPVEPPRSLYLLPGFDEYVLGYRERGAVLDAQYADRICPGGNGMFKPTIVVDGEIVGTWKRTLKKSTVVVEAEPFMPLTAAQRDAFAKAADAYAAFLGLKAVVA